MGEYSELCSYGDLGACPHRLRSSKCRSCFARSVYIRFSVICYNASKVAETVDELDFVNVNLYLTSPVVIDSADVRFCDVYLKFDSERQLDLFLHVEEFVR